MTLINNSGKGARARAGASENSDKGKETSYARGLGKKNLPRGYSEGGEIIMYDDA